MPYLLAPELESTPAAEHFNNESQLDSFCHLRGCEDAPVAFFGRTIPRPGRRQRLAHHQSLANLPLGLSNPCTSGEFLY
jgi:hypothetical protein